ncbi:MAG: ATP-binding cassette domain-containing protein, partial [Gammaproteobacteria bacterium]|nr:ATP-binding cassette domain-containing protein [Gammaproteobacteria bacterium]
KDRDIAMVFQSYALYPNMTVAKNISFGMEIRKVSKAEQKATVDRVANMLQIEPLLNRKPSQLSGGQRQRVAMGRALARNPSLFLFDEPLSNLDAKLRVEMRTEIKQLHQRMGTTIVYVTHDQIEAMTLGDRIAVMKDGEVQQFGAPRDIYDDPANMFVAGFMGSPSMNFIPGKIVEEDGSMGIRIDGGAGEFVLDINGVGERLQSRLGSEIVLGLRPEQITQRIEEKIASDTTHVATCKVEVVEPTGPDTLLFVRLNDRKVVCRVEPESAVEAGQSMELMFDVSKAVFFDPESGARV